MHGHVSASPPRTFSLSAPRVIIPLFLHSFLQLTDSCLVSLGRSCWFIFFIKCQGEQTYRSIQMFCALKKVSHAECALKKMYFRLSQHRSNFRRVRRSSVGSASACSKADLSSILGLASRGGFSCWAVRWRYKKTELGKWRRMKGCMIVIVRMLLNAVKNNKL